MKQLKEYDALGTPVCFTAQERALAEHARKRLKLIAEHYEWFVQQKSQWAAERLQAALCAAGNGTINGTNCTELGASSSALPPPFDSLVVAATAVCTAENVSGRDARIAKAAARSWFAARPLAALARRRRP